MIEVPAGRFILDPTRREIRKLPARGDEGERRLGRFLRLIREGQMVLTSGDGGKVAGLSTRRLVLARDGQPFLALSIEPRTAVVLKRESFGPEGGSVGVYEFTRFEPRPKIDGANFVLPKAGYRLVSPLDDLRALSRREGITVATLSPSSGYRLEGSRVRRTGAGAIIAAFYSGGGKRLTLFASRGELPDLSARGTGSRTPAPGVSLYRWRVGTTSYGLLGEESPARLRALAGMLTP